MVELLERGPDPSVPVPNATVGRKQGRVGKQAFHSHAGPTAAEDSNWVQWSPYYV